MQAYKLDMTSAIFTWMFPGWFSADWWKVNDTSCDPEVMDTAVNGYIGFEVSSSSDYDGQTDVSKLCILHILI